MPPNNRHVMHRLHRDESGQIMILFLFIVLLALAIMMLNISTGMVIEDKLRVQTAADLSALSGAAWVARTMNHVSMNNVAMTETLAWILVLRGIQHTVNSTRLPAELLEKSCCPVCFGGGLFSAFACPCCIAARGALIQINILDPIVNSSPYEDLISTESPISLWKVMQAFQYMNKAITLSYPGIGEADAFWVARKNKAKFAVLVPYPGLRVPVKDTGFCDLCDPTMNGSRTSYDRGYEPLLSYDRNQGPLKLRIDQFKHLFWPMIIVGGPYTFKYFTKNSFTSLCGDCLGTKKEQYYNITMQYEKARQAPHVESSCWYHTHATYGPTTDSELPDSKLILPDPPCEVDGQSDETDDFDRMPPQVVPCPGYLVGSNDFSDGKANKQFVKGLGTAALTAQGYRELGDGMWARTRPEELTDESGNVTYKYHIDQYKFAFAKTTLANNEEAESIAQNLNQSSLPKPTMLSTTDVDELLNKLSYVAVAYKPKRTLPFEIFLSNPNKLAYIGYAQVLVHNPTAVDLFTQDWQVKLVPADKLNDALSLVDEAASHLPSEADLGESILDDLVELLRIDLSFVNHH